MPDTQNDGWYTLANDPNNDPEVRRMMEEDRQFYERIGWPDPQEEKVIYVWADPAEAGNGQAATRGQKVPVECLPYEDAASFLGVSVNELRHLVKTRKIRYIQIGDQRGRVFRIADLRAFLDERTVKTAEEELRRRGRR